MRSFIGELPQPEREVYGGPMHPTPFVGRQLELSGVRDLVASCRATSRPVAAIVCGDMGVGKTRLLQEICREHFDAATRLPVTGFEVERVVPLSAAARLLDLLTGVPEEGPRLSVLLDGSRPLPEDRLRILEAARRCLVADPPAVLIVDDLQWVDELSAALTHYLLRAAQSVGLALTVLIATRPTPAAFTFADSVARVFNSPGQVSTLDLQPLDRADGVRLVRSLSPGLGEDAASRIWENSGGLPFWLSGLTRSEGQYAHFGKGSKLHGLSADSVGMALVLALLAAPGDIDSVRQILGWTQGRSDSALAPLSRRGLVISIGHTVSLVHDIVREAVCAAMPESVVRGLHGRIADFLEKSAGDDIQILRRALAHRQAGGATGADLALRILRADRSGLLSLGDLTEIAEIANSESTAGDRDIAQDLRAHVAGVASQLKLPGLAADIWTAVMVGASTADERARAALMAAIAALECGDRSRANVLFAECQLPTVPDPDLEIRHAAFESELRGNSSAASELPMLRATKLADRLVHDVGGISALPGHARTAYLAAHRAAYYFALRKDRPDAMLGQADLMGGAADSTETRLSASLDRVLALRLLARYREAASTCRSVRIAAVREQLPALTFMSGHLLAGCLYSLGQLEAARAASTDVTSLAERAPMVIPSWLSAAWINALVPEIDVSTVGWAHVRDRFDQLQEAEPDPHFRLHIRLAGAQWAARLGGDDSAHLAEQWSLDGARDAKLAGCSRCAAEQTLRSAEVYARIGQHRMARSMLDRWDAAHNRTFGQSALWRARAEGLTEQHHHPSNALHAFQTARSAAEATGAKLELLWCQLDVGSAIATQDRANSIHALSQAADLAGRIGAVTEERLALQLLRTLGIRTWRRGPQAAARTDRLTERELSIAQMISDGASNPEIAEALFLSRKTIERHVSNALTKTGSRNRAELAARLSASTQGVAARGEQR